MDWWIRQFVQDARDAVEHAGRLTRERLISFSALAFSSARDLRLGERPPFLRHLGLERLQPFLDVFEVVTLPAAARAEARDRLTALFQLIRYPQLTPVRLLDRRILPVGQLSRALRQIFQKAATRLRQRCAAGVKPQD